MSRSSSREQPDALARPRHGAHRGGGAAARAALGSLVAVLAVVAIVGGLWALLGRDAVDTSSADDSVSAGSTYEAADAEPTSEASTGTAPPRAPRTPRATPARTATPTPAPTPAATPTPEPSAADPQDLQVIVLNQTGRNGLAAGTAARLRAAGWSVTGVGNFRGTVPSTTVYYPDGAEAAARALAADLDGPDRVRPRFSTLSSSKLTVVLAS
ncbi:LytR C-terminal domain-containing protein [Motilibacter aurantiacus]|uniref:LytR C-terminal domain-containing protein n=1 Tax=Motilibacter aurantiacus TaxID=2714955 RepID=UPI00140B0106|nr:LytR C-terminal domain-containing protein [Motilibacter aurantiacus]NHC46784.1 LytR C-terminal domain-containing protein [Motilibacter aurantiacus]